VHAVARFHDVAAHDRHDERLRRHRASLGQLGRLCRFGVNRSTRSRTGHV
jgi:hypothetical protein